MDKKSPFALTCRPDNAQQRHRNNNVRATPRYGVKVSVKWGKSRFPRKSSKNDRVHKIKYFLNKLSTFIVPWDVWDSKLFEKYFFKKVREVLPSMCGGHVRHW
jgi:hypothetical protein